MNRLLTRGLGQAALVLTLGLGASSGLPPVAPVHLARVSTPEAERRTWTAPGTDRRLVGVPDSRTRQLVLEDRQTAPATGPVVYRPAAEVRLVRLAAEGRTLTVRPAAPVQVIAGRTTLTVAAESRTLTLAAERRLWSPNDEQHP